MKTFLKKNLLWVFALVLGIGTMSFNLIEEGSKATLDPQWYYTEEVSDFEHEATRYITYSDQPCPGTNEVICSLNAPDSSGYPKLSQATNITYKN